MFYYQGRGPKRYKLVPHRLPCSDRLTDADIAECHRVIAAFDATHWRDDDSPQAEMTFGVKRAA